MSLTHQNLINIITTHLRETNTNAPNGKQLTEKTALIQDLGLSSVDFVVIFEKIQSINLEKLNFIDLIMPDRCNYVEDLSIEDIYKFVNAKPSSEIVNIADTYVDRRESISQKDVDLLNQSIQHQKYNISEVHTQSQLCFLLSAPRSGSTLLRRMLNCHQDIYAPMELHLMSYQDFAQRREMLKDGHHEHLLQGTIVARQEIRGMTATVSKAVETMYAKDQRSVTQFFTEIDPYMKQKVLIDKTPTYCFSLPTLQRLKKTFPEAKFIHLTRCPNAVIKSLIDSNLVEIMDFFKRSTLKQSQLPEALWCLCEKNIYDALADVQHRTKKVNYEELVTSPEETMSQLHEFLGLEVSLDINPYDEDNNKSEEKVSNYAGDLKTFLRTSIDPSVATEWTRFKTLQWLSEPTLELLQDVQSREDNPVSSG